MTRGRLECGGAVRGEVHARAEGKVFHGGGDEDLGGFGESGDAGSDVDGHAGYILSLAANLAGVQAEPEPEADLGGLVPDSRGAPDGAGGAVEDGEESPGRRSPGSSGS